MKLTLAGYLLIGLVASVLWGGFATFRWLTAGARCDARIAGWRWLRRTDWILWDDIGLRHKRGGRRGRRGSLLSIEFELTEPCRQGHPCPRRTLQKVSSWVFDLPESDSVGVRHANRPRSHTPKGRSFMVNPWLTRPSRALDV